MDLREKTTDELLDRVFALDKVEVQISTYGFLPRNVEDEVFDGDPDPEYVWNSISAIDAELIRRAKQEAAA